jgi:hypothetical protein
MRGGTKAIGAFLALAGGCLALWPLTAAAAPPANDDFAGRVDVSGPLPITGVSGSNVDASEEENEHHHEIVFEPAGRSVWFSWEAEDSEWVTVSTCGSDFDSLLGVYSGGSLSLLEKVVPGKEGPRFDCGPGGQQVTFEALAGTTYEIRVDGNLSPQPPDAIEGSIALRIESTPAPANDDFEAAQPVTAESLEGGTFYRVDVPGFNWNASKQLGEPAHGGDQGGASVWYSWTAPASGEASVVVGSGALEPVLGVYTGDSLTGLTSVGIPTFFREEIDVHVTAGTTYLIAVDGLYDAGSGAASMGQLTFLIYLAVPPPDLQISAPSPLPPPLDVVPPRTAILKREIRPGKRRASFAFRSSEVAGKFLCKLDARKVARCGSPKSYAGLAPGPHAFRVRAVDAAGNADPTQAVARFSIPRP